MIDIKKVSSVTTRYIFYKNDEREKVNLEKLESMFLDINNEVIYYRRLWDDLLERINIKQEEIDKMNCPTDEEIRKADLLVSIDLKLQRENYFRFANNISGLSSMFQDVSDLMHHYERLQRQVNARYTEIKKRK